MKFRFFAAAFVRGLTGLLVAIAALAGAAHAQPETTLTYTGNNFTGVFPQTVVSGGVPPVLYTTSDRVEFVIKLASPLGPNRPLSDVTPIEATATDGLTVITLADARFTRFQFATDSAGNISAWDVRLVRGGTGPGNSANIHSRNNSDSVFDRATDELCSPNSGPNNCDFQILPSYAQFANNSNVPGTWSIDPPANMAPTANAGPDQSVRMLGETVMLDGSASFDDNTESGDLQYAWQLTGKPGGSAATLTGADTAMPTFVADVSGTFTASLVVTDSAGQMSEADEVVVSSANLAPTAEAGPDQIVPAGVMVDLDGSASSDPEDDFLTYAWMLTGKPANSNAVLFDTSLPNPFFQADVEGTYVASLVVSDMLGASQPDEVEITAIDPANFAQSKILEAAAAVNALDRTQVGSPGNKTSLYTRLVIAVRNVQNGRTSQNGRTRVALTMLDQAIKRVDGCALRGSPDQSRRNGDWVTDCDAQTEIYFCIKKAIDALKN